MLAEVCLCLQQELNCNRDFVYKLPHVLSHMVPGALGTEVGSCFSFPFS